jgi:sugar/nucleoside kinase (ribokinase family)
MSSQKRILVVGALTLDRLLYVDKYPKPDSKSSCTSRECGGGNAANTACCIGNLCLGSPIDYEVQLLSKVSTDQVGKGLCDELIHSNVNLSSPLFIRCDGSKSSVSTVIVTCDESHTRTCIFDPGTVGTLNCSDVEAIDYDTLFHLVKILHSDTRHTDAAVRLAREAKRRGIRISIDVERDRNSKEFDELIDLADIVFTGEDLMQRIVQRRRPQMIFSVAHDFSVAVAQLCHQLSIMTNNQTGKELIVTRGEKGAWHCELMKYNNLNEDSKVVDIDRFQYVLRNVGSARDVNVVDTTGAGDSFIGGFLFASQLLLPIDDNVLTDQEKIMFQLRFASWVAARKISGQGARGCLPTWHSVEIQLGSTVKTIHKMLRLKIRCGES